MKQHTKAVTQGFAAGLAGALCCVTPLVLILLGLSGITGAAALAGYWQQTFPFGVFAPIAFVFLLAALYFQIRKKEGSCDLRACKKNKWYIIVTIASAVIVWVLLLYVLVPIGFSLVQ